MDNKEKLAILSEHDRRGVEIVDQLNELEQTGYQIDLITPGNKPADLLPPSYVFAGCSSDSSDNEIDEGTTQTVLDHHWKAFVNNDIDGVMEDYTDESILITPDGIYRGLEEIRSDFVNAFTAFPTRDAKLSLNTSLTVRDVGYILWEAETPTFNLTYATDTFVIRKGKIIRQTFAGVRVEK